MPHAGQKTSYGFIFDLSINSSLIKGLFMKVKIYSSLFILFSFLSFSMMAQSVNVGKETMNALRIDKSFKINGKMDSPLWANAKPVELKYEVQPGDNTPAPQKTLVRAMYDDKFIYFGFQCFDTHPEQIRANISDRDNLFQDDYVIVLLDTYGDYQRAYELAVNPFGIKGDLMRTSNNEDESFDMIWYAEAARNDNGWTAEMAIPFSSLNFPDKEDQSWVLEVVRTLPRASRTQISWTKIDRNIPALMPQAGLLVGLKNIQSEGKVELLPYLMGQKSGYMNDYNNPNSGIKFDPVIGRFGGGVKYSPTADITIDAVINPDFSQIESDAAQISVNTTFALNYDEKRPFFLTGRELLPNQQYYSRSINDPLYAGRIIGKTGGLTFLYMGALDRNTVFVVPGEDMSSTVASPLQSVANIGRARYDFGDENYIGGMLFTRNMEGGHNYVLGMDWNYKFWTNWYFGGSVYFSQTKELNDTTLFSSNRMFSNTGYNAGFNGEEYTGAGASISLNHSERSYNFKLSYSDFSPTYQTYDGLFTRTANRNIGLTQSYILYPENSFFDKISFSLMTSTRFNYAGVNKEKFVSPGINLQLKGQTNVSVSYFVVNDENFFGVDLTGVRRVQINLSSSPVKEFNFSAGAQIGRFIYRSSSPTIGTGHNIEASLQFKPTSQLDISFSYSRAQLRNMATDDLYYDGNIYRAVAIYQFTSEILFRTIVQYNTFGETFQLYPLFSYKMNAFTTFFAGATSNYLDYKGEFGFRNTDQQYFVKLQYLIGV